MKSLNCEAVSREALAAHLASGEVNNTQALPGANVYHCRHDRQNSLAIALDSGTCLLIESSSQSNPAHERRRRKEATAKA